MCLGRKIIAMLGRRCEIIVSVERFAEVDNGPVGSSGRMARGFDAETCIPNMLLSDGGSSLEFQHPGVV